MAKIILDLCSGTGSWSKPYKDAGYDVRAITLPNYDLRYLSLINLIDENEDVYGILAAPPCTQFSFARTNRKNPTNFAEGLEIVNICLRIIQEAIIHQWNRKNYQGFKFWAMENPVGYLSKFIGRPAFIFQPYEFGDRFSKKTCLWGHFNIPKKNPIELSEQEKQVAFQNRKDLLAELPADYVLPKGVDRRAARRAITPANFARAFMEANK